MCLAARSRGHSITATRMHTGACAAYPPVTFPLHALQLPKQCVWELEMKGPPGGAWHIIHPMHGSLSAVADRLTPGTKYIFRARAGEVLLLRRCTQPVLLDCGALLLLVMWSLIVWHLRRFLASTSVGSSLPRLPRRCPQPSPPALPDIHRCTGINTCHSCSLMLGYACSAPAHRRQHGVGQVLGGVALCDGREVACSRVFQRCPERCQQEAEEAGGSGEEGGAAAPADRAQQVTGAG